jgi:recombination protein RecA
LKDNPQVAAELERQIRTELLDNKLPMLATSTEDSLETIDD